MLLPRDPNDVALQDPMLYVIQCHLGLSGGHPLQGSSTMHSPGPLPTSLPNSVLSKVLCVCQWVLANLVLVGYDMLALFVS